MNTIETAKTVYAKALEAPADVRFPKEILSNQTFSTQLLVVPSDTLVSGNPPAKSKCAIVAGIDWNGDGVTIRSEFLDEDGYGWSYEEAWDDFLTSLRDRYSSLAKREERLSPADRETLKKLRAVITF